ncbi:uncharacterized protein LOC123536917 [Mercenaria mercenaria]|uniref:uncharacterized protein LOC123536917 n=1 Tax=Mercenaria mercenaria TaxID=6596 RepID=UPI00234F1959|nr:uncharacterized protein LOC123536917 [Mercenaria mercenaria]
MKIPDDLISDVVNFVNKQSIMKSYDFLKKRNICCWGLFLLIPFTALICCLISLIGVTYTNTRKRPDRDMHSYFSSEGFESILPDVCLQGGVVMPFLLLTLVLTVPRFCHREQRDLKVQRKLCEKFLKRCIENDVIIVFSGRENRRPKLRVVRYAFDKCRDFLENIIRSKGYTATEDSMTPKDYADTLIAHRVAEMSEIMSKNYDDLPDASHNRHNVRKGKMCLCQQIEIDLQIVRLRQMSFYTEAHGRKAMQGGHPYEV